MGTARGVFKGGASKFRVIAGASTLYGLPLPRANGSLRLGAQLGLGLSFPRQPAFEERTHYQGRWHRAIHDDVHDENKIATITDIGLSYKQVHEARMVRDAEARSRPMRW